MTGATCPYCRAAISEQDEQVSCEGCDTPHHLDCYQENGGCTVFGCNKAPADEPKLRVSTPELSTVEPTAVAQPVPMISYSPLGLTAAVAMPAPDVATVAAPLDAEPERYKNKVTFILLGALLGPLGAHNFYAGFRGKGAAQLGITVCTLGYGAPMSWIWAIIDICTVERDSQGIQFKS